MAFWGGLARRLLPAAMLVLFTVAVASMIWLPRTLWDRTIQQTLASIFYVETGSLPTTRWTISRKGVPQAPCSTTGPVHTGQIYFLWPIVFALSIAVAARLRVRARTIIAGAVRRNLRLVVCALDRRDAEQSNLGLLQHFRAPMGVLPGCVARHTTRRHSEQAAPCRFWLDRPHRHRRLRSDLSGIASVPRIRSLVARRLCGPDPHGWA